LASIPVALCGSDFGRASGACDVIQEVSEADRLLARGAPVTIAGKPARLIFTFEALERLEEEFGGLDEFVASLREEGLKKNRIRNVRRGMVAGLLHTKPEEQDIVDFELEVRAQLDFRDFMAYLEALTLALTEAMPRSEGAEAPKVNGSGSSRGRSSTGIRRRTSAAQTASSGT